MADKPVLVDFWAEWCGPCRQVSPILDELAGAHGDKITFLKMNVDENPVTPSSYRVTGIPTINVYQGGQVVKTHRRRPPEGRAAQGARRLHLSEHGAGSARPHQAPRPSSPRGDGGRCVRRPAPGGPHHPPQPLDGRLHLVAPGQGRARGPSASAASAGAARTVPNPTPLRNPTGSAQPATVRWRGQQPPGRVPGRRRAGRRPPRRGSARDPAGRAPSPAPAPGPRPPPACAGSTYPLTSRTASGETGEVAKPSAPRAPAPAARRPGARPRGRRPAPRARTTPTRAGPRTTRTPARGRPRRRCSRPGATHRVELPQGAGAAGRVDLLEQVQGDPDDLPSHAPHLPSSPV